MAPVLAMGAVAGMLPIFLKPMIALGISAGLMLAVIVFRNPRIGLLLIAATIPLETAGRIGNLTGNLPLTIPKLLTVLTLLAWLTNYAMGRLRYRRLQWMYLIFLFAVAAGISLIGASELRNGMEAMLRLGTTIIFFFLIVQLLDSPKMLKTCLLVFVLFSTAASSIALIQRFMPQSRFEFRMGWEEQSARRGGVEKDIIERDMVGVVERSSGISMHSIQMALNVVMLLAPVAALAAASNPHDVLRQGFWIAIVGILLSAMVVSYARTGFILMLFTGMLMLRCGLLRITSGKVIVMMLAIAIFCVAAPKKYTDRVLSFDSYTGKSRTISTRLQVQRGAMGQFMDHPLTGVGYGKRYGIFAHYPTYSDKKHAVTPHNAYIQVLSQTGLLGLIMLGLFLWRLLLQMWRAVSFYRRIEQHQMVRIGYGLGISVMVFLFAGLAMDLFDKGMPQGWLMIGMCAAYAYLAGQEAQKKRAESVETETITI